MPRANLPYRGEPEYEYPPPKPRDWNTEKRRGLFGGTLWIVLLVGAIFFVIYFAADRSPERSLGPALFFIAIVLAPFALDAGINAWNRYLRADDLDEPEDLNERREETDPKQDDKHDMAEDYLAQLKWGADHLRDPNRGIPPARYDPKWTYKPLYGKVSSTSFGSSTGWGILFLIALIVVAGYSIFQWLATSVFPTAGLIFILIFLGLTLLATREPKEPTDD